MNPNFTVLTPGRNALLTELHIHASAAGLSVGIILIALLLSHCAHTDLFHGRVIRNRTVLYISLVCAAMEPLVLKHPWAHLPWVAAAMAAVVFLSWVGTFKAGDAKLYMALSILFGQAMLILVFVSFVILVLYGVPMAAFGHSEEETAERHRRRSAIGVPAGPAIALSLPVMVWLAGFGVGHALIVLGVELFGFAAIPVLEQLDRWVDEPEPAHMPYCIPQGALNQA